jgi:hypothetical protein
MHAVDAAAPCYLVWLLVAPEDADSTADDATEGGCSH